MMKKIFILMGIFLVFIIPACRRPIPKAIEKLPFMPEEEIVKTVKANINNYTEIDQEYQKKWKISLSGTVFSRLDYYWASDAVISELYRMIIDQEKKAGNLEKVQKYLGSDALISYIRSGDIIGIKELPELKDKLSEDVRRFYLNGSKKAALEFLQEKITDDKLPSNLSAVIVPCDLLDAVAYDNKKYDICKKTRIWLYRRHLLGTSYLSLSEIAFYIDKLNEYDDFDKKILVEYYNKYFKNNHNADLLLNKREKMIFKVLKKFKMIDNLPDKFDVDKISAKSDNKS